MINKNDLIYLPGSTGLVGSSIKKKLIDNGYTNILQTKHKDYDLRNQSVVDQIFKNNNIKFVILSAALVGGIIANSTYQYDFIYDNIMIQSNIINNSIKYNIEKLIFLGSSCIYPKNCPQPIKEQYLLSSELQPTNQYYAIAKIAGVKLCQAANKQFNKNFISLMPTNLYGQGDNFDQINSHVIPSMIRKFHQSLPNKDVYLYGSGEVYRQFMHVDDLSDSILFILQNNIKQQLINVGMGKDITIKQLSSLIQSIVNHTGNIYWDKSKPDGMKRKLLDSTKINQLGWKSKLELEIQLPKIYQWYINNYQEIK